MKREKITSLILTTVLCVNNSLPVLAAENELQGVVDNASAVEDELNNEVNNESFVDNIDLNEDVDLVVNNKESMDKIDDGSESNVVDKDESNLVDNIEESDDKNFNFEQVVDIEVGEEIGFINEDLKSEDNVDNLSPMVDSVLEITLDDGEFVPVMDNNPDGYTHVIVRTIGSKSLEATDFNNLRKSKIPNIDLSNAYAEVIPAGSFSRATHVTSFSFPQGLRIIEGATNYDLGAFSYCTGLTGDLTIPDTVTTVGDFAFFNSGFGGNLTLSSSLETIGRSAFFGVNFTGNLNLPNGLISIGEKAFSGVSKITGDLVIPNTVTSMGREAFNNCYGLNGKLVLSNSLTSIPSSAFSGCSKITGDLIIPDSVTSIESKAFYNCRFNGELVLSNNLKTIGFSAFQYCSGLFGELNLPSSLTIIDSSAFYGCTGFTGDLVIPDSVTKINASAFERCSGFNGTITLSNNLQTIGEKAFFNCTGLIGDLIIPSSVSSISSYAFCNARSLTGKLVLPNSLKTLGGLAFDGTSLSGELIIPSSLTVIGDATFRGTKFSGDLVIPSTIQKIGDNAFASCTEFTGDLIIPDTVTQIGNYAFSNCSGFDGRLVISNSLTKIPKYAFSGCSNLSGELNIPSSVTYIDNAAFMRCSGFSGDLVIPDTVTYMGTSVFYGCLGFDGDLVVSKSLRTIPNNSFEGCSGLTGGVELPNDIVTIGYKSFANCSGLTDLSIPENVTTIDTDAFKGCSSLTGDIVLPSALVTLKSGAFDDCDNLNSVILRIDETDSSSNFKKSIIDNLNKDKAIIEMSYNLDISDTFINQLPDKMIGKPKLISPNIAITNSFGSEVGLLVPTNYNENDIIVYKDGEIYSLPKKNSEGMYIFNELGNYEVEMTTTLGTRSSIEFEVVPLIEKPIISNLNGDISVQAGNHNVYQNSILREDFSDTNTKLNFSNQDWIIDGNGYMTSNSIRHNEITSNEVLINAMNGDKVKISVKVSSQEDRDFGKIYINGIEVYSSSGGNSDFDIVELNLKEGQNILKFEYIKDSSTSKYDDRMYIEYIEIQNKELVKTETIEYRVNNGNWIEYSGNFKVPVEEIINGYVNIQTRVIINGLISDVTEAIVKIDLPEIIADDKEIYTNESFDELDGVKAIDIDGVDISTNVEVSFSDVKVGVPGKYKVIYRIDGKNGYTVEKEISVTIIEKIVVPENPSGPGDTNIPVEPEKPSIPVEPNVPVEPERPSYPDDANVPMEPEKPSVPIEPSIPVKPETPEIPSMPVKPNELMKPEVPSVQNQSSASSIKVESSESFESTVTGNLDVRKEVVSIIDKLESDIVVVKGGEFNAEEIIENLLTEDEIKIIDSFEVVEDNINTKETGVYKVGYKFKTIYGEEFIRYVEVSVKSSEDILDSEVVFGLNKDISNDNMESVNKNTNIGKNIYVLSLGISLSAVSGAVFALLKIRKNK